MGQRMEVNNTELSIATSMKWEMQVGIGRLGGTGRSKGPRRGFRDRYVISLELTAVGDVLCCIHPSSSS